MTESLFAELKRYVDFSPADEAALRALHPAAAPHFQRIAEIFYDRILSHSEARKALEGGESQVGRLKVTLVAWMHGILQGPWDEAYFEQRCRIGRVHVRIALPQHYMFAAMNVMRREFQRIIDEAAAGATGGAPDRAQLEKLYETRRAVNKILDLELAIMLHTYREDLETKQARNERLSTYGQLMGTIGHELRNPLAVMESSLHILRSRVQDDERARKHLDRIAEQVAASNRIITGLLDIIRDAPLGKQPVRLAEVIERAVAETPAPAGAAVSVSGIAELPEVQGDPDQLRQVFLNLLQNALQALPDGKGHVKLAGARHDGRVEVAVEDDGPGVDPATQRRLFEPLVTTKKKGVGLGLAWVKRIVERHGGTITYEAGRPGARFVVRLPV
ncbi:MAG TPA: protoglobin domain-containing protein [Myxococcales bacterium]|nr:protoglobin domain-containing protein [Myxococcales bacterium]